MKNKYKEKFDKIKIDENMKERILNAIDCHPKKMRLSYSFGIILILLLTFTYVSAKETLKKWGNIIRETENNKLVLESERQQIITNVDELVIQEPVNSEFMKDSDIKTYLGISFLSLNQDDKSNIENSNYTLWSYMPEANDKVQNITISQYGKKVNLTAYIITKNFPMNKIELFNFDNGYDYRNLIYIDTVFIENLGIDAQIYTQTFSKNAKSFEYYHIEFSYENIKYILSSTTERTLEEMLEVLSTLKK